MVFMEYLKRYSTKSKFPGVGEITHHCHWLHKKRFALIFFLSEAAGALPAPDLHPAPSSPCSSCPAGLAHRALPLRPLRSPVPRTPSSTWSSPPLITGPRRSSPIRPSVPTTAPGEAAPRPPVSAGRARPLPAPPARFSSPARSFPSGSNVYRRRALPIAGDPASLCSPGATAPAHPQPLHPPARS
jgi:hypothetical protein